jgi:hypothetical protein
LLLLLLLLLLPPLRLNTASSHAVHIHAVLLLR